MEATHATGLLADTGFWVLAASLIFAVIAYKKGKAPVLALLDSRSARIRAELEEAERLKAEALELYADIQKKHRDAVITSEKIIATARDTAARLQKDSAEKLTESLARREEQLLERITRAENAAIQALRAQAADIAATSAEILLKESMDKRGIKLVEESIGDISAKLN